MKNALLILSLIVFPLMSTHSQVVTGGNDFPDEDSMVVVTHKIQILEKHLIAKDAECSNGERLLKEGDIMQTYLKLSLFKKPKASQNECDEINRYFACLNDKQTQHMKKYVNKPHFTSYLVTKHKLSEAEAKVVVKFYNDLGEKVK